MTNFAKKVFVVGSFSILLAFAFVVPTEAFAACPFQPQANRTIVNFPGNLIVANESLDKAMQSVSVNLPAGTYNVSLYAYDSYPTRVDVTQPNESYYVQFVNNGSIVARSNASQDIPDYAAFAEVNSNVGTVSVPSTVNSIVAMHAAFPSSGANSLHPSCAAFDLQVRPLTVSCTASPRSVAPGELISVTANPSGGTGVYTYDWSDNEGNVITNGPQNVPNVNYSTPGNKVFTIRVSSGGLTATASCSATVVTPTLSVSCSANPSSVTTGQSVTWTASPVGGTGSYTYYWSDNEGSSGDTGQSMTKSYSTTGTKTATVRVTSGSRTVSATCRASVTSQSSDLSVSCYASPSSTNVNRNVSWHSNVSGGTGSYRYSWTGTDNLSGSGSSVSKSYSSAGTKNATVTVTSGGASASANCNATISDVVSPTLYVSCYASPSNTRTNRTVYWYSNVSGGTGSYTYSWTGTDDLSSTRSSASKSYVYEGTKTATITVVSGSQTVSADCNATITESQDSSLRVSCYASPSNTEINRMVRWYSNVSGGNGNYTYSWTGENLSGSQSSASTYYSSFGYKNATVTVASGGQTVTATCNATVRDNGNYVNYYGTLNGSCSAGVNNTTVGSMVTWSANASGGNGFYTYYWYGDENFSSSNQYATKSYTNPGTKNVTLTITSNGQSITRQCSVNVNQVLGYTETSPLISSVYLSEVPYTGAGDNIKIVSFVTFLAIWSGLIAYLIIRKRENQLVPEKINEEVPSNTERFSEMKVAIEKDNKDLAMVEDYARSCKIILSASAAQKLVKLSRLNGIKASDIIKKVSESKSLNGEEWSVIGDSDIENY